MMQEGEKGELVYRFVINLFRITETNHYNNGLSFIENITRNNLMCFYGASILNLTEKRRFLYLNLVQCRHTPGQV